MGGSEGRPLVLHLPHCIACIRSQIHPSALRILQFPSKSGQSRGDERQVQVTAACVWGFPVCALGLHTMFVRSRPRQTGRADLPASTRIEKLTKRLRVRAPRIERSLRLCVAVTFMMHSEDFNDHTVLQIDLRKPSGHSAFNSSRRKHKVPVQNVLRITS
jgi:hypothetical protein